MAPAVSFSSFNKRVCAYHNGDTTGGTYDESGNTCSMWDSAEKVPVIIAACFCGGTLLVLAIIFLRRLIKRRAAIARLNEPQDPYRPMSMIGTPLITTSKYNTSQTHHQTYSPFQDKSPSASSSSSHSSYSSSPKSDQFHFPMLSADGHLLPPNDSAALSSSSHRNRPLPSPPLPTDMSDDRTYSQINRAAPSEDGFEEVVGLYPGMEIRTPSSITKVMEKDGYSYSSVKPPCSPSLKEVDRSIRLQRPQVAGMFHTLYSSDDNGR